MIILAIDTSGKIASCALARGGEVISYIERDAMLDHSSALLDLCGQMLAKSHIDIGDVDIFAAAAGPGSFTGVRIGVAAAKGFGWTQDKPCAGVSTLMAMSFAARPGERVCCRVSALRGEFYYAFFERIGDETVRLSEDGVADGQSIDEQARALGAAKFLDDAQNARGVALAAFQLAQKKELLSCHELTPTYLRKPQAQRLLEERESSRQ